MILAYKNVGAMIHKSFSPNSVQFRARKSFDVRKDVSCNINKGKSKKASFKRVMQIHDLRFTFAKELKRFFFPGDDDEAFL
jgi:hypothetical protein